jgi:hypothetical protein
MSRHYYDTFRISQSPLLERALQNIELLHRVADHKGVFFKVAWAKYDQAKPGTLRLTPNERILSYLKRDYEDMQPMFFGAAPSFAAILEHLGDLEDRINSVRD